MHDAPQQAEAADDAEEDGRNARGRGDVQVIWLTRFLLGHKAPGPEGLKAGRQREQHQFQKV